MTPAPVLQDQAAREAIRTALGESLWVEAAAGTGKTTELVNRIVAVLRAGRATIDAIVAVTFTNKAAGELKLRLRQKLDECRESAEGRDAENIANALERLEDASIGTIHAFCAQILRERPVEAGIDPAFVESPEQETRAIFARAFQRWFEKALEDNPPGLRRALARLAWSEGSGESASDRLQSAASLLVTWRDFPARWARPEFDRDTEARLALDAVQSLVEAAKQIKLDDAAARALAPARELADWADRRESAPDYDTLEALILDLPRKMSKGKFGKAKGRVENLFTAIEAFKRRADADLAALLQSEMSGVCEIYDDLKAKAGVLDFQDLLMRVRNLLRDNAEVRGWLQSRFSCIYVDEFQDTDPLQAEILLLLAADNPDETDWRRAAPVPGKLFAVGDPKQSIYKFRRADARLYNEICERLQSAGVRRVELTSSFRAVPPLQECINAAFAPEMVEDADAGQAGYVPLDKYRPAIDGQPAVVALPAPRPYKFKISKEAIEESLPGAIAAFVDTLVRELKWNVCDPVSGALRPVKWSDIAVLFRKTIDRFNGNDLTRILVRGLESRDIPHLLVGSKAFYEREEVDTVRTACEAIEWPEDELSVYATLHGALFAINDDVLLRYRHERGRLHPLVPREGALSAELQPVADALDLLARLHRRRNRRAVADTIGELLEATRAHIGFAFRPGGHHVLGNVYRVLDLARSFELERGLSFRGFIEDLNTRAARSDSSESPMVEEAAEGVRILTVHSSKGLEFPVVILADLNTNLSNKNPERYLDPDRNLCAVRLLGCAPQDLLENIGLERDRERAEGVRIAYVAATRARDVLVVPVVGDEERKESWVAPLNKAVYPDPKKKRWATVPDGCPRFGSRSVLERAVEASGEDISVKPGGHRAQTGSHEVVWWDPATLSLDATDVTGLPNASMLVGEPGPGEAAYNQWRSARESAARDASRPSHLILSPSETTDAPPGDPVEVEVAVCPRDPGRPAGRRFGTLVHQLLRTALDGSAGLAQAAQSHGRVVGAPADEVQAAVEAVETALRHPVLERSRGARSCHRELPVSCRLEDGRTVEGNVDLAFEDDDGWVVVDFKTDADVAAAAYANQIRWYAFALSRLTGRPARCILLAV